jgi:hypothetical protein
MSLWGNNDQANSKPIFPTLRDTVQVTSLVTANSTTAGNTIIFTGNTTGTVSVNNYVYTLDNNLSRFSDGTIIAQHNIAYFRSNNSVTVVDSANGIVRFANNVIGTIGSGNTVWFGSLINYRAAKANNFVDTVLVTATRLANAVFAGGSSYSSAALFASGAAACHIGWNKVVTGTGGRAGRVQTECLITLANPTAANTLSGNTSNSLTYYAGL